MRVQVLLLFFWLTLFCSLVGTIAIIALGFGPWNFGFIAGIGAALTVGTMPWCAIAALWALLVPKLWSELGVWQWALATSVLPMICLVGTAIWLIAYVQGIVDPIGASFTSMLLMPIGSTVVLLVPALIVVRTFGDKIGLYEIFER